MYPSATKNSRISSGETCLLFLLDTAVQDLSANMDGIVSPIALSGTFPPMFSFNGAAVFKNDSMLAVGYGGFENLNTNAPEMIYAGATYYVLRKKENSDVFNFKTSGGVSSYGVTGIIIDKSTGSFKRCIFMLYYFIYDGVNSYLAFLKAASPILGTDDQLYLPSDFVLINTK